MAKLDLEAELDRVYTLPLKDFVKGRDELAKALRDAGDRPAADRVKALKKPSVAAWAVNQLPSSAPKIWSAVIEAADGLRSVKGADLRGALQERRDAVNAARRKAEQLLVEAGHAAETATMMKVAATLEALATYGSQEGRPSAGRLSEELEPPSFDEIAALSLPPVPAPREVEKPMAVPRPAAQAEPEEEQPEEPGAPRVDEVALARARKEAARARAEREARAEKAAEAKRRLKAAGERAEFAGREREELERKLKQASQEEARATEAAEKAREALETAEGALKDAEKALEEAEAALARSEEGEKPPPPRKKKR